MKILTSNIDDAQEVLVALGKPTDKLREVAQRRGTPLKPDEAARAAVENRVKPPRP